LGVQERVDKRNEGGIWCEFSVLISSLC
jgi:hypothetical protein